MSSKTFRLQGIPAGCTEEAIAGMVKEGFGFGGNVAIKVRSLAKSVLRVHQQVATLEIDPTPPGFDNSKNGEWRSYCCPSAATYLTLDTHFEGLTPLYTPDQKILTHTIVAISGLGGHAFGSFKRKDEDKSTTYVWLRDSLPADLPSSRVVVYGYNTRLQNSASIQNISDLGETFRTELRFLNEHGARNHGLILIGHSLGGIVVKEAISQMQPNGSKDDGETLASIKGLLFFGVPNRGMEASSLILMTGNNPNRTLVEALGRRSRIVQTYTARFEHAFTSQEARIYSFYETELSPTARQDAGGGYRMDGPLELLVDPDSACCGRSWERGESGFVHAIARNHSELVKLRGPHDREYAKVLWCLRSIVDTAGSGEAVRCSVERFTEDMRGFEDAKVDYILKSLEFPEMRLRYDTIEKRHSRTFAWLFGGELGVQPKFLDGIHRSGDSDNDRSTNSSDNASDDCDEIDRGNTLDDAEDDERRSEAKEAFHTWAQDKDTAQPILWVSGKAGSGKSTLMKYTYSESSSRKLQHERTGGRDPIMAGYFFFGRGSSLLQKSLVGLFRTLLHQIISQRRELALNAFGNHLDRKFGPSWSLAPASIHKLPDLTFTLDELESTFKQALEEVTKVEHVCILVDGLDEYHKNHDTDQYSTYPKNAPNQTDEFGIASKGHKELINVFQSLRGIPNLKICLSSRPLNAFEDAFRSCPRLRLHELTYKDIRYFVSDNLKANPLLRGIEGHSRRKESRLIETITENASGVFLWVRVVVQNLLDGLFERSADFDDMFQMIQALPSELGGPDGLYMRMLRDIPMQHRSSAVRILRIALAAMNEGVFLTPARLQFSRKSPKQAIESEVRMYSKKDVENANRRGEAHIRDRCRGLVEVRGGRVEYLHQTVMEFVGNILERGEIRNWGIDPEEVDPYVPLLISGLMEMKHITRLSDRGLHRTFWINLHFAYRAERSFNKPQTALLDDLAETTDCLWRNYLGEFPNQARATFIRDHFHWATWLEWLGPNDQLAPSWHKRDFFQLALLNGLQRYVGEKIDSSGWRVHEFRGEPTLAYAVIASQFFPSSEFIEKLFGYGAKTHDEMLSGDTTWQRFLQFNSPGTVRSDLREDWARIVKLFLHERADVTTWAFKFTEESSNWKGLSSPAAIIIERAHLLKLEMKPFIEALTKSGALFIKGERQALQLKINLTAEDRQGINKFAEHVQTPEHLVAWKRHLNGYTHETLLDEDILGGRATPFDAYIRDLQRRFDDECNTKSLHTPMLCKL